MTEVEMFDIFNEEMIIIGKDSRANVHAKGLWHQTFHCWIINQSTSGGSSLLFQLHHKDKDSYPGLWMNITLRSVRFLDYSILI